MSNSTPPNVFLSEFKKSERLHGYLGSRWTFVWVAVILLIANIPPMLLAWVSGADCINLLLKPPDIPDVKLVPQELLFGYWAELAHGPFQMFGYPVLVGCAVWLVSEANSVFREQVTSGRLEVLGNNNLRSDSDVLAVISERNSAITTSVVLVSAVAIAGVIIATEIRDYKSKNFGWVQAPLASNWNSEKTLDRLGMTKSEFDKTEFKKKWDAALKEQKCVASQKQNLNDSTGLNQNYAPQSSDSKCGVDSSKIAVEKIVVSAKSQKWADSKKEEQGESKIVVWAFVIFALIMQWSFLVFAVWILTKICIIYFTILRSVRNGLLVTHTTKPICKSKGSVMQTCTTILDVVAKHGLTIVICATIIMVLLQIGQQRGILHTDWFPIEGYGISCTLIVLLICFRKLNSKESSPGCAGAAVIGREKLVLSLDGQDEEERFGLRGFDPIYDMCMVIAFIGIIFIILSGLQNALKGTVGPDFNSQFLVFLLPFVLIALILSIPGLFLRTYTREFSHKERLRIIEKLKQGRDAERRKEWSKKHILLGRQTPWPSGSGPFASLMRITLLLFLAWFSVTLASVLGPKEFIENLTKVAEVIPKAICR